MRRYVLPLLVAVAGSVITNAAAEFAGLPRDISFIPRWVLWIGTFLTGAAVAAVSIKEVPPASQ